MKAEDVRLTELLEGPKQFIVPVFQRDYSWGTKHCLQLWKDILNASESGGVIYSLDAPSQIAAAMHIVRQAYQKVSE
jgi:uncharacterized protein with ParB-like and HNH nuclease domain